MSGHDLHVVVNGVDRCVRGVRLSDSLLAVLRDHLGLTGAKDGCSEGYCGSCLVLLDDELVCSCLVPAATLDGADVVTPEGLEGPLADEVRGVLVDAGAVQCGYCTPGLVMSICWLVNEGTRPGSPEAIDSLAGNLCRCTGYGRIRAALVEIGARR